MVVRKTFGGLVLAKRKKLGGRGERTTIWNEANPLRTTAGERISRGLGSTSTGWISPCGFTRRNSEWTSNVCDASRAAVNKPKINKFSPLPHLLCRGGAAHHGARTSPPESGLAGRFLILHGAPGSMPTLLILTGTRTPRECYAHSRGSS